MKLQPASRKEITRISLGTLICDAILVAVLFLLSLVGVGSFEPGRIFLGVACGSVVAIVNFTVLCLTVQSAVGMENKRKMKAKFQLSYNIRLLVQAVWVVAAFLIPQVHFVAGAAPVLFPNVVIYFLQFTGRLLPKQEAQPEQTQQPAEAAQPTQSGADT